MAKVGAQRAAELTGRSKSTIQRAMGTGKLSFEVDANGRRTVDVSELDRVFGLLPQGSGHAALQNNASAEAELKRAADMLEIERLKMRVKMLEEQVDSLKDQLEDNKAQRDQWQKQAQQVLLTSQYSQKQAEELKAELVEQQRRVKMRRMQELEKAGKLHKPANPAANTVRGTAQNADQAATDSGKAAAAQIQGLWQKIRGEKTGDKTAA
ncbi:MerR family transcriptional regulator [Micavibrio aeruginosavorus]|uniref:Entry exclusion 1 domain protein n=1 Tax=Micavibrio aeruginosavorus (strain ARL-13) TaxID=856793 RepID=G2KPZ8_MICAA|nr:entry exclusion 1 domain-containing protein [Micavibrio aeruginosavorus]AEP10366.1 entry exclusion 1 domain protein [Micavibrio aeruginosavorus ARL-13]